MISIEKSETADTRTCDYSQVSKQTLLDSSLQHKEDVYKGIKFMSELLLRRADKHDFDKIIFIDKFHADFITGFKQNSWYRDHIKLNRHHLTAEGGVPEDVNLIDVLEMVVDCVMAGMARSGSVYDILIPEEVLTKAVKNTVELLKSNIVVKE